MRLHLRKAYLSVFLTLTCSQAHAITPSVIYGDDNRQDYFEVVDAIWKAKADSTVALIRASSLEDQGSMTRIITVPYGPGLGLCATEPYFDQQKAAFCSGFLVNEDTVVSAGHCIRTQESCRLTKFVFGFRVEQAGSQNNNIPTSQVYSCQELIHSVALPNGEDFSVVKLDRPVTDTVPLSYRASGRPVVGDGLLVIGHPAGLPVKLASGANVRMVNEQFMVANLDTYGGNSGSAVFNAVTGDIEGILVRGELDYVLKDGCRVSNRCEDAKCRGEDVTLFERVLPFLQK
jgi:hypothetical protein